MRIGIVNDMTLAVETLRRAVESRPGYRVVWVAHDGAEAVTLCARETPDVILMDLIMPVMDGVEATRRIMARTPCAILITTVDVRTNAGKVFAAMGHGAFDAVNTPVVGGGLGAAPLMTKLESIQNSLELELNGAPAGPLGGGTQEAEHLIAIGTSAGGPAALATVLKTFPENFLAGIVLIQHVDAQFAPGLASWLDDQCALPVRLAVEGDRITPGQILLADGSSHLVMRANRRLTHVTEYHGFHTPSVDAFFGSLEKNWPGAMTAVVLTGMGRDGAVGLKKLRDRGVHTMAQDEATCAVYGMPKAAAKLDAAVEILPLEKMGPALVRRLRPHHALHAIAQ